MRSPVSTQGYFYYQLNGASPRTRRDKGAPPARVDSSLSCASFRDVDGFVAAKRPDWPPALRSRLAALIAAGGASPNYVMPAKGGDITRGERVY